MAHDGLSSVATAQPDGKRLHGKPRDGTRQALDCCVDL
jgi:hypothetical protein